MTFAVGDRVVITAKSHPWTGHTGVISRPLDVAGLDWCVRLDESAGHEAGAAEYDLALLPEQRHG